MRRKSEIQARYDELWDRVWWNRHQSIKADLDAGVLVYNEAEMAPFRQAEEDARCMEDRCGRANLVCTPAELAYLIGQMSALAWALGADWDGSADT